MIHLPEWREEQAKVANRVGRISIYLLCSFQKLTEMLLKIFGIFRVCLIQKMYTEKGHRNNIAHPSFLCLHVMIEVYHILIYTARGTSLYWFFSISALLVSSNLRAKRLPKQYTCVVLSLFLALLPIQV